MAKKSRPSPGDAPKEGAAAESPSTEAAAGEGASPFLLVGIGASSGGLDAFSQILRALPPEPGLSLVFVQHMAPHHESMLATLLAPSSSLPVQQLEEDTEVEPNHIYVIPPNRTLRYKQGWLSLHPRPADSTQYTPINRFFESLAEELGSRAVVVVLSGSGTDGAEGIVAIKGQGGVVLVQEPESAKFDGMPHAAIGTGKVDLILTPQQIADELVHLVSQYPSQPIAARKPDDAHTIEPRHLEQIFGMLRNSHGVDFSQYKLPTVQRRIQRRMALQRAASVDQYVKHLKENPAETSLLFQDIFIHVTRFFREPESFDVLRQDIFPALTENRRSDAPLRVWVPGCSTGEEAYSVAIALMEFLEGRSDSIPIQIFATDISDQAVERARGGLYPPSLAEDISPERLRRFFSLTDGHYRVNKTIRDMCIFARQDLTRDPPFSKLDLIVCRNVLIYLGQAVQSRLINIFHYALKPTGFLVLGAAETIGPHSDLFAIVDKKHRVFRKKLADAAADVHFTAPYNRPVAGRSPRPPGEFRGPQALQSDVSRLILDRYSPPGVVVNDDLRIVQFRGQTGRFLEPAPGDASLNLLKMCREGLLHGLRTALQSAKKKRQSVRREGLRVKANSHLIDVAVEVIPIDTDGEEPHYLVLFLEEGGNRARPAPAKDRPSKKGAASTDEHAQEIERLHSELIASREYLQSIIQDLEATNEELQSANEEILSSNEELQSTNEELDRAKEELQSTNEELNTVNEELHSRNEELATINSDLVNLLNGVRIAIVIVAGDLRIRRFTPMAERVLNLISGDIGRPISQIKPNINCPDLERLIVDVIDNVSVQHREVQDAQGRWFSLTIRPYKNVDNRIDGAVLALFDTDEVRRHEMRAQEARDYAEAILATTREAIAVLDVQWQVQAANQPFYDLVQSNAAETAGRSIDEVGQGTWSERGFRQSLEAPLAKNNSVEGAVLQYIADGNSRRVRVNARQILGPDHRLQAIVVALSETPSAH